VEFEFTWAEISVYYSENVHFFRVKKKKKNYKLGIILMTLEFEPNWFSSSKLDRYQIYDDYGLSIN
jgi:hypothetical protein